jgi:hypothetical protein
MQNRWRPASQRKRGPGNLCLLGQNYRVMRFRTENPWLFSAIEQRKQSSSEPTERCGCSAKIGIKIVIDSACVQVSYNTYT